MERGSGVLLLLLVPLSSRWVVRPLWLGGLARSVVLGLVGPMTSSQGVGWMRTGEMERKTLSGMLVSVGLYEPDGK